MLAHAIHREHFLVTMLLRLLCCCYAVAMLLLCGCYAAPAVAVAMLLLCGCYAAPAVAVLSPCGCYAVAMRLLCGCCFITLSVLFSFFPLFFAKLKYFKSSKKICWHVQFIENIFLLQCCYGCCAVAMRLLCGCYAVACFITFSVFFSFFPLFFAKLKIF